MPCSLKVFLSEAEALASLDHPNVVKMTEFKIDGELVSPTVHMKGIWFIMLEYVSETTMINMVVTGEGMKLEIAKKYFKEMLNTLLYIKSRDISHRDIKLENMLLDSNY